MRQFSAERIAVLLLTRLIALLNLLARQTRAA
jgi:hypothetical protein